MDSSDDELLNNVVDLCEESFEEPDEKTEVKATHKDLFAEVTTVTQFDPKDLPDSKSLDVLFKKFGHRKFRPLQWKIINSILKEKRDNLAIMTTGYGKSLCYQFPAVFSKGITLVISPLVSLMEDQVLSLTMANIPACLLGTAQSYSSQVLKGIFNQQYSIIYLTPEYCASEGGEPLLKQMAAQLPVTLIAIDEAHCVSSWGHDFRHSYRKLGIFKTIFPTVPVLAVTATATEKVKMDIVKVLKLRNPQMLCSGFDRPNLYFEVRYKTSNIMNDLKSLMIRRDGHLVFDGPTIIYCIRRKDTESLTELLQINNIPCLTYHAGMSMKARKEAHENFVKDKVSVIIATIAFGMGIDKPDIRLVIHYGTSGSIEGYYQEVGRAGRDGLPSKCVCFYSTTDFQTHNILNKSSSKIDLISTMKEYLMTRNCRRQFILSYFNDKSAPLSKINKCCDNCAKKDDVLDTTKYRGLDENGMFDFTDDAVKYLTAVENLEGRYGHKQVILILRGSKNAKVQGWQKKLPCYGTGSDKSEEWWKAIAQFLEFKKYLKEERHSKPNTFPYSTYNLTSLGSKFLYMPANKRKLLEQPSAEILKFLKEKQTFVRPPPDQCGWISTAEMPVLKSNSANSSNKGNSINNNDKSLSVPFASGSSVVQETEEELEERLKLVRLLKNCRNQLALANDCMPYMVASDYVLMEIAKRKPTTVKALKDLQIEGLTEARIEKFGDQFVNIIKSNVSQTKASILDILTEHPLTTNSVTSSAYTTYEFLKSCKSVEEVAQKRSLAMTTVIAHLIALLKMGYPIKLEALGVTPKARATIIQVINSLGGNYSLLTPIKLGCPENISYENIKSVCAYLEIRDHLKQLGIPYEEFEDFVYQENVAATVKPQISEVAGPSASEADDEFGFDDNDDMLAALCDEMQKHVNEEDKQNILNEISQSDSDLSPPIKKHKSGLNSSVIGLESPPRQEPSVSDQEELVRKAIRVSPERSDTIVKSNSREVASSVTVAKKKLPQWLSKKK